MTLTTSFFIIALLVVSIWVIIEFKRMKHKIFAFFLIGLIIFTYATFTISLQGKNVTLTTVPGMIDAGKLYFSWLGSVFVKAKTVTMYAIGIDWKDYNESVISENTKNESIWDKLK